MWRLDRVTAAQWRGPTARAIRQAAFQRPEVAACHGVPDLSSLPQALAVVLLVPPVNLALLALAATLLGWRRLAGVALVLLLLLALPAVSVSLLVGLEHGFPTPPAGAPPPAAIVILGGDVVDLGDATDRADVGVLTLQRLRAGAALSRATQLPVLVTGGVVNEGTPPVAALMARSLADDFGITARWIEPQARDTWDNAQRSAALLRRDGIASVYVVTHAWHMRRALVAFAATGLTVVAAPLPADRAPNLGASDFVPRVASWLRSYFALHEWIGGAWYGWRLRAAGG
jgi:uncharacterized SAM-binding protein YcdF (DUF218 family)